MRESQVKTEEYSTEEKYRQTCTIYVLNRTMAATLVTGVVNNTWMKKKYMSKKENICMAKRKYWSEENSGQQGGNEQAWTGEQKQIWA